MKTIIFPAKKDVSSHTCSLGVKDDVWLARGDKLENRLDVQVTNVDVDPGVGLSLGVIVIIIIVVVEFIFANLVRVGFSR